MEKTECDTLIDALVRQRTNDTVQTILFILFSSGKKSVLRKEQTEQKKKKNSRERWAKPRQTLAIFTILNFSLTKG